MLILKRRREQGVKIGPDVTVRVVAIQDGAVTLAIEAPAWFKISRTDPMVNGVTEDASPNETRA